MKINKRLLIAVLAGTMIFSSGVSTFATSESREEIRKQEQEISAEIITDTLDNVDKILEKLERTPEVKKLNERVKEERKILNEPQALNVRNAKGMLKYYNEEIDKIKHSKPQPEFETKEEAEKAAKKDLETELINNDFELEEKNGKWHYTLKIKEIDPEEAKKTEEEAKKKDEVKKAEETKKAEKEAEKKDEAKKAEEEAKKKSEKNKKVTLIKKAKKEKKSPTVTKGNTLVKKAKIKKKLPKAGSEAEILTLATASLASVVGAFVSLKKRK